MQDSRGKIKTLSITIKVLDNDGRVWWTLTELQRMRDMDKEIFSSHCKKNQFKLQKSHFYRNRLLKSLSSHLDLVTSHLCSLVHSSYLPGFIFSVSSSHSRAPFFGPQM